MTEQKWNAGDLQEMKEHPQCADCGYTFENPDEMNFDARDGEYYCVECYEKPRTDDEAYVAHIIAKEEREYKEGQEELAEELLG